MSKYRVVFSDFHSEDGDYYSQQVEAKSFGINTEADAYEFYDGTNNKVFSAPRTQVLFVKLV
jgi:uncharacterized membrane-anchored protein